MDGDQYLINSAWTDPSLDPYTRGALAYAYTHAPLWRPVADAVAARNTRFIWEGLPAEIASQYEPGRNLIVLGPSLRNESGTVLAAVLAHETYHASHGVPSGVGAEFQEEINAFAWQAYVWSQVREPRSPQTAVEAHMGDLLHLWQEKRLDSFVLMMPEYQRSLMGSVLVSP